MRDEREIFRDKKPGKFVGKIIIFLVLMCIIAAMTDIRLNPKRHNSDNVTEINFQY